MGDDMGDMQATSSADLLERFLAVVSEADDAKLLKYVVGAGPDVEDRGVELELLLGYGMSFGIVAWKRSEDESLDACPVFSYSDDGDSRIIAANGRDFVELFTTLGSEIKSVYGTEQDEVLAALQGARAGLTEEQRVVLDNLRAQLGLGDSDLAKIANLVVAAHEEFGAVDLYEIGDAADE